MKKFYCIVAAMLLAACTKEETSIAKIEEVKNPYAVTPDEAVQLLKTVIGGETTRAVSIGDIKTLRKSDFVPTTRGGEDGDLIYIVDLENGGSAVMGADKRMEPIYAILDETKVSPEQLTFTATRSDDGEQDIEEYVMGLVNNKIQVDVMGFEHTLPEMPMIPRPHEVTKTTMLGSKNPMLRTKWHQRSPYNDRYPKGNYENQYFVDGVMVAGCGPIAISQVLYFHQLPTSLYNGNYYPNFNLLSECEYQGTFSDAACAEVANYMIKIAGELCDYLYHTYNPRPTINDADLVNNLTALGLDVDSVATYNIGGVITLLDDNLPVIISGAHYGSHPLLDLGHMWVIDGYKSHRESIYLREYFGGGPMDYTDTFISSTDYNLVHCNYGWGGSCDGYYSSGVFDLTSQLDSDMIVDQIGDIPAVQPYIFNNQLMYVVYEK